MMIQEEEVDSPVQLYSVERMIGNTPLVEITLDREARSPEVRVYAKVEWTNPGGSIKDRAALAMILDGERRGLLGAGRRLIDATSGNTGIAYATLCAARGYGCTLVVPSNVGAGRLAHLQALGAEIIPTDPMEGGTDEAQRVVAEIVAREPGRWFHPDQYNNSANTDVHTRTTAVEIWRQTGGTVTHFVAAIGTSGTFVGTSRGLRNLDAGIRSIAVQPDAPLHGIEGVKHLPTARLPGIYDPDCADAVEEVSTDEAYRTVRRLAREQGLFAGVSSGANVAVALRLAAQLDCAVVVTVLCDTGMRYLGEPFWHDLAADASKVNNRY